MKVTVATLAVLALVGLAAAQTCFPRLQTASATCHTELSPDFPPRLIFEDDKFRCKIARSFYSSLPGWPNVADVCGALKIQPGAFNIFAEGCTCQNPGPTLLGALYETVEQTPSGGQGSSGNAIGGCQICFNINPDGGLVAGDPHFTGFDGSKYEFKGWSNGVFNLISEEAHQVNAKFDNLGFLAEGSDYLWMTAFGIKYTQDLAIEVTVSVPEGWAPELAAGSNMSYPRIVAPAHPIVVKANDLDMSSLIGSDETVPLTVNGEEVKLHFPAMKHADDSTDGPVLEVQTPDMKYTVYFETEGALHLDVGVKILSENLHQMHGVLGQTFNGGFSAVEGEEAHYEVKDGLMGNVFAYNKFSGVRTEQGAVAGLGKGASAGSMTGLDATPRVMEYMRSATDA